MDVSKSIKEQVSPPPRNVGTCTPVWMKTVYSVSHSLHCLYRLSPMNWQVKFSRLHAMSGAVAPLILTLCTRWRWMVNFTPRQLCQGKKPGTHWAARWVAPIACLDVLEKSRTPDLPARSQSLFHLFCCGFDELLKMWKWLLPVWRRHHEWDYWWFYSASPSLVRPLHGTSDDIICCPNDLHCVCQVGYFLARF